MQVLPGLLRSIGVNVLSVPGCEADDVIATLCVQLGERFGKCATIFSRDKVRLAALGARGLVQADRASWRSGVCGHGDLQVETPLCHLPSAVWSFAGGIRSGDGSYERMRGGRMRTHIFASSEAWRAGWP